MSIPGLLTAMVTPYQEDLSVDYLRAAQLAEYLCDHGSEALVVCGTTGESPVLKPEEKLKLFSVVKERVGGRVPVWAGTGSNDTRATVELSQEADKLGVDGIMLVTPYYNKPTQEGLYRHFKTIAERVQLPVMLYNVPGRTSSNLLPETIARLAEISNIKAVKEASGNMDQVSLLKSLLPDEVVIYSGDDSLTLPLMAIGAQGVVSIASHIVGPEIRTMVDAFKRGELETARRIHLDLFPIFKGQSKKRSRTSPSVPRKFISSDDLEILVGRNNRQNDLLSMKMAERSDLWLHTKNSPGTHVIIKLPRQIKSIHDMPDRSLEEAALLAAHFSKAAESEKVEVDYTFRSNVKKPGGARPGMVIYDQYWTLVVNPQEDRLQEILSREVKNE